jgi:N-glycosylase/DNA lyase
MKIKLNPSSPFNMDVTLCCGQTFRWDKQGEWWYGVVGERVLKIHQIEDCLEIENADTHFVRNYLGLHDDLTSILSQISKDKHIKQAIATFGGLRILRQDPWECLISYICATYKNIAAIKRMLLNLSCRLGDKVRLDSYDFYTFPTPEQLAKASADELAKCGLGYRAKYVHETAKMVYENLVDFERLKKTDYDEARAELLRFPGIGQKVADCILLFSLDKFEAFPIDVWIKRVILRHYRRHFPAEFISKIEDKQSLTNREYEKLGLFGRKYFGKFAGYAQEYLYHYERTLH